MIHRTLITIVFVLVGCVSALGQASYRGLTPGKSTRAEVARALGQPLRKVSPTLSEYKSNKKTEQTFVQYRPDSAIVERIEKIYSDTVDRSVMLRTLNLPPQPTAAQPNSKGRLEEYFPTAAVVLTYGGAEITSGVKSVGYYSRELFESAASRIPTDSATPASNNSLSGRWSGSWKNTRGGSGDTSVNIHEQDTGTITGDENGWVIENGQRSGNVLTWHYRNQNNGCRDYRVRWEVSSDGKTANGTYKVTDRCEMQTYTGTYLNYRR